MDFNLPPEQPKKNRFSAHRILGYVFLIVVAAAVVAGIYYWQTVRQLPVVDVTAGQPDSPADSQTYTNNQYGFTIPLPQSWTGYTVLTSQWQGRDVSSGQVIDQGPIITLRHPEWTAANPREDMPVMVFTLAQWMQVQNEQMSLGAAPIPPSLLAQNSKYVLALPARYNYDYQTGYEEVDQIIHTLQAIEPQ